MGLGPSVYLAWFGVVIAALIVAIIHLVRKRFRDLALFVFGCVKLKRPPNQYVPCSHAFSW